MYISICEVLDIHLKAAVDDAHGHKIGLNWPATVVDPLSARIDERNAAADWEDEAALRAEIAQMRDDVVEHFPHIEPQPEPEETEQPKPKKGA